MVRLMPVLSFSQANQSQNDCKRHLLRCAGPEAPLHRIEGLRKGLGKEER